MMTPNMLNRASQAFRCGYHDGYEGYMDSHNRGFRTLEYTFGSFQACDYEEGVRAGANDRKWSERNAKGEN